MLKIKILLVFIILLISFSNFNLVSVINAKNEIRIINDENLLMQNDISNDSQLCFYPGPENVMFASVLYNDSIPVIGAKISGFVDYACGNQSARPIDTVITSSNGTVALDCSFCNTFGPFNITITTDSQNNSFYIKTTMKYLGQVSWAKIDLTNHSYSLQEMDATKCNILYTISFTNNKPNFYCTSQTTTNFYPLSFLIIPLYAIIHYRKKKNKY